MPQLSDLRDSGSLEQDADVVLFVHRAAEYEEGKDPSAAQIKIAKNRHGPSAIVVPARVDLATGRWSDIDMASSVPAGVRKVFPDARPVANGRANQ